MAPVWEFKQRGQSGLWISELFPQIATHADKLCLIRSMKTDVPNHPPAFLQMHCGIPTAPRPSMGAWITYGLGTANENLPGFVTLSPNPGNGGPANYGSSFLPAIYQGTRIGNGRAPIAQAKISNLAHPQLARPEQRAQLDFVQQLNKAAQQRQPENAAIEGLIEEAGRDAKPAAMFHWVELVQHYVERFAQPWQVDDRLHRIWERVAANVGFDWTLDELARQAHVSTEHLRRLCRKALGRTPMHHVTWLRMRQHQAQ
jgi:hypothetical protein